MSRKKGFYIFVLLLALSVGIFMISNAVKGASFSEPKQSDFSLELKYDGDNNKLVAKLRNLSDNDYDIMIGGLPEEFIQFHITHDSEEIPGSYHAILSRADFPKDSAITRDFSLADIGFSDSLKAFARTSFYITNPDTSEKYTFDLESNTVNLTKDGQIIKSE